MTNEKVVKNLVLNEKHFDIFPLAAIFGTSYILYTPPSIQRKNIRVPNMAARGKMS